MSDHTAPTRGATLWKYSNLGIALLGHALGRVAGQPYETFVQEQILAPLGMRNSGFQVTAAMRSHLATGYVRHQVGRPQMVAPEVDIEAFAPAGSLYSTAEDLARFIALQFRAGDERAGGAQVLRGSSIREMHTVQWMNPDWRSGWGIGFELERVADRVAVGHAGGIHGFSAHLMVVPVEKIGVAVLANTNADPEAFARKALELLIPVLQRAKTRTAPADTSPPPPSEWQQYVGVYEHLMGDVEIRLVQNRLVLSSPDAPPGAGVPLVPEGPHRFRMKGGFVSGESLVFERDAAGNVTRALVGPYPYDRRH